jgi:hypothetical protein
MTWLSGALELVLVMPWLSAPGSLAQSARQAWWSWRVWWDWGVAPAST